MCQVPQRERERERDYSMNEREVWKVAPPSGVSPDIRYNQGVHVSGATERERERERETIQ